MIARNYRALYARRKKKTKRRKTVYAFYARSRLTYHFVYLGSGLFSKISRNRTIDVRRATNRNVLRWINMLRRAFAGCVDWRTAETASTGPGPAAPPTPVPVAAVVVERDRDVKIKPIKLELSEDDRARNAAHTAGPTRPRCPMTSEARRRPPSVSDGERKIARRQ